MSDESKIERPLLLYLLNGREVQINVDPTEWTQVVNRALRKNHIIEIKEPLASNQRRIGINPRAILYWKSDPSATGNWT